MSRGQIPSASMILYNVATDSDSAFVAVLGSCGYMLSKEGAIEDVDRMVWWMCCPVGLAI